VAKGQGKWKVARHSNWKVPRQVASSKASDKARQVSSGKWQGKWKVTSGKSQEAGSKASGKASGKARQAMWHVASTKVRKWQVARQSKWQGKW
jgi:hypothetical protein